MTYSRLLYVKRSELIRRESLNEGQPNRYCRVMAYNETHGMLVVSQVNQGGRACRGRGSSAGKAS